MGKGKSSANMGNHIQRQEASGMSAAAYCKRHKLNLAMFYYWRKKLPEPDNSSQPTFKEIRLTPGIPGTVIHVQFGNGIEIRIEGNVSAGYLRELAGC